MNKSTKDCFASKSNKHVSIIDLSERTPNALMTIKRGIGFFTFGILTTILLFVYFELGATIRTEVVLFGFDESSDTERIFATWE